MPRPLSELEEVDRTSLAGAYGPVGFDGLDGATRSMSRGAFVSSVACFVARWADEMR